MNEELFSSEINWETLYPNKPDFKIRLKVSLFPRKSNLVDIESFHDQESFKQLSLSLAEVQQLRDKLSAILNNYDKISKW